MKTYDLRFSKHCSHLVCGPSASGKTYRVTQILKLKNQIIVDGEQVKNVIFCYAAWQSLYDELKQQKVVTKWINTLPTNEEFIELVKPHKNHGGSIVVFDDFQGQISDHLSEIVRVTSRHFNCTIFILHQSLFPPHKQARQISLNVKYIHLAKSPRESGQVFFLARQISPHASKWIVQAFEEATRKPFSWLLFDVTQTCPNFLRLRSDYLPSEWPMKIWTEKGKSSML